MGFDDKIHELELSRQSIETIWFARIVPDDPDVVISDVTFFVVEMRVVRMRGHHRCGVIEDLTDIIPPTMSIKIMFFGENTPLRGTANNLPTVKDPQKTDVKS